MLTKFGMEAESCRGAAVRGYSQATELKTKSLKTKSHKHHHLQRKNLNVFLDDLLLNKTVRWIHHVKECYHVLKNGIT